MNNINTLPLIIEPEALQAIQDNENLLIIDLSTPKQYQQAHIPDAVFIDYGHIVGMSQPYTGLLPEAKSFAHIINSLGITPDTHIVAYDEEGGGKAARLIWTLHAMGHNKTSMLNGGLIAWYREKFPLSNESVTSQPNANDQQYAVDFSLQPVVADTDYIKSHLDQNDVALLDARSIDEYMGQAKYAQKTGRIPGAKHFEWSRAMDESANYRLLAKETLQPMLNELGLTQDKEIIVYPTSKIDMPSTEVEFKLSAETLDKLQRATGTLAVPDLVIRTAVDDSLVAEVLDKRNDTSNTFSVKVGNYQGDSDFNFYFLTERMKMLPGDYDVEISAQKISKLTSADGKLTYWIALEQDSTYE